jgi:tetratricopeptide (TPR) repeat protein
MRGDLIQMSVLEANYELADAAASYRQAVAVNPLFGEAYESIGYYYDVIEENFTVSETAFRKAVELKAGQNSYFGLARVLAEQGKREEVLQVLAPENCPFHSEFEIDILRDEIAEGQYFHPEGDTE